MIKQIKIAAFNCDFNSSNITIINCCKNSIATAANCSLTGTGSIVWPSMPLEAVTAMALKLCQVHNQKWVRGVGGGVGGVGAAS